MIDQSISTSQRSQDVVERANDLHRQHRAMIAPGGVWDSDLHHRYVLALQAAWPLASATIASLREQVERLTNSELAWKIVAEKNDELLTATESRVSVLEGALRDADDFLEGCVGVGSTTIIRKKIKAALDHTLPVNQPHDASAVISEIAKSGDDRRGVNAGSTSSDGDTGEEIRRSEFFAEAAAETLSPDTARADREAIERGVRFYCRGYVHDSHGEDRIYFSGILISGLVDAIADALSKGGGTTEGSEG